MGCNGRGMRGPPEEQAGQWMTRSDEAWDAIGLSLWPGSVCKIKKLAKPPTRVCVWWPLLFEKRSKASENGERAPPLPLHHTNTPAHCHMHPWSLCRGERRGRESGTDSKWRQLSQTERLDKNFILDFFFSKTQI